MKQRILAFLLILILCCGLLSGCNAAEASNQLHIICTIFPQYDWTREVLGERIDEVELTLLTDNGADLHNYQATAEDIVRIAGCDLFLYNGGQSDEWAANALKNPTNPDRISIAFTEALGANEAVHLEGMEEDEHGHEEHSVDEHLWLSLNKAQAGVALIAEKLAEADPAYAAVYKANGEAYSAKLQALDDQFNADMETAARKHLLFADRFPFSYLAADYGLTCYAAFSGCSAETEASFETIAFLSNKIDELSLPAVMVIESGDQSIAKTVIANTKAKDQKILTLDSLQSVTKKRMEAGETYLSIMEKNRSVLYEALH